MSDVYGTDSKLAGVFKGTSFALSVGGSGGSFKGALVQQLQISYQRQLTRIWELGSRDQYFIEGHTAGQGGLQRIVGPKGLVDDIVRALADVCTAASRAGTLSAVNNGCNDQQSGGLMTLDSPVVTGLTFGADVGNFLVNSGVQMEFTGLQV